MACYHPLRAYHSGLSHASGKSKLIFRKKANSEQFRTSDLELPCGQCIGCRIERTKQWATRIMHENQMSDTSCFITLTYNDEHLPKDGSLNKKHFQLFMKRLRKKYEGKKIRFFHCGEYGDKYLRPHYHAILFGVNFFDRKNARRGDSGSISYESEILQELWSDATGPIGHAYVGDVTYESAAYVARYCIKKVNGKKAFEHYKNINYETGEIISERLPEYITMSNRPGIGSTWYDKYYKDCYPSDFLVIRDGVKVKPPKYYDKKFSVDNPSMMEQIKKLRISRAELKTNDNTYDRLAVREEYQLDRVKKLKRGVE